jgi:hypothetical protein
MYRTHGYPIDLAARLRASAGRRPSRRLSRLRSLAVRLRGGG